MLNKIPHSHIWLLSLILPGVNKKDILCYFKLVHIKCLSFSGLLRQHVFIYLKYPAAQLRLGNGMGQEEPLNYFENERKGQPFNYNGSKIRDLCLST